MDALDCVKYLRAKGKKFDVVVLDPPYSYRKSMELYKGHRTSSGYDLLTYIHDKYGFILSSGTLYSLLYSMERNYLVEGTWQQRRRVYCLAPKGTKTLELIEQSKTSFVTVITEFLGGEN
jgi:DNA-binding PadR family transcriptional regulator